ncbi:MAG: hypothetical protein EBV19_07635 [Flavobacteriia bacterium]|nr:hypothetical protein [Flavobacteriia bacterium]
MEKMKSWIDSPDDINKIKAFTPTLYFPTFEDDSLHIFMPHGPHLQHNLKMGAYTFDTLYDYIGFYVLASMTHNEKFAYQHMIINKGDNDMFIQFQKGLLSYKDKLLKKALTTRYKDRFFGLVLSSTGKKPIIYMDPFDTSLGFISGVAESNMFGRYLQKIRSNLLSASFKEEYRSLQPIAKDYPFLHDWISGRFRDVLHTLRCINEFTGTKLNEKQTTFFMKTLYKSFFLIHTVEHKDTTHTSSYKPLVDNIVDFYCKQCLAHVVSEDVAKMAMSIVGSVIHYMVHKCDNDASQMIKWISENIKDKEDAPNNSSIVRLFIDMVRAFPKEQRIKSLPYLYRCIVMTDDIPKNPPKVSYQVFENITFSFVTTDMIRPDLNILIPRVFHKNTEGIGLFYFYAHNILSNSSLSRLSFLS